MHTAYRQLSVQLEEETKIPFWRGVDILVGEVEQDTAKLFPRWKTREKGLLVSMG